MSDTIELERKLESVEGRLLKLERPREKDAWDKIASLSTIVSATVSTAILGAVGLVMSHWYDVDRLRSEQLTVIEKYLETIGGDSAEKRGLALVAIASLGHESLALRMAKFYPKEGALEAVASIAEASSGPIKAQAEAAKTFLVKFGEERRGLYDRAVSVAKRIPESAALSSSDADEFWRLHNVELLRVESDAIASAMRAYGRVLRAAQEDRSTFDSSKNTLAGLARDLSDACASELLQGPLPSAKKGGS